MHRAELARIHSAFRRTIEMTNTSNGQTTHVMPWFTRVATAAAGQAVASDLVASGAEPTLAASDGTRRDALARDYGDAPRADAECDDTSKARACRISQPHAQRLGSPMASCAVSGPSPFAHCAERCVGRHVDSPPTPLSISAHSRHACTGAESPVPTPPVRGASLRQASTPHTEWRSSRIPLA